MNSGYRSCRAAALLLCLFAAVAVCGCSNPAPIPVPPARAHALSWNKRGLEAENRGNHDGAIMAFEESLRINRSIEDFDGIAVSLLNLARVHRQKTELPLAKERIEEALRIVSPDNPLFTEAAFEKAKVELALGSLQDAEDWARKAIPVEKKPYSGRMQNLLSRILFLEGKTGEALPLAIAALESNKKSGERAEEANSLRLIGDITLAGGDPQGAQARYLAALEIDKELAESAKIASDLRALGAAAFAKGETAEAMAFYERAAQVSRGGNMPAEAKEALSELDRIKEASSR
ncbi:MAG: tetratricopeptide repeat protein [Syntrophorhabdaceae bacterium]|nr:tetratricopeptide repeat protein [Syntrophorhabdaceae bacterium]